MKKYNYQKIFLILFLFYFKSTLLTNIRVLLTQFTSNEKKIITLNHVGIIEDLENHEYSSQVSESCTLEYKNDAWFLNNKKLKIKSLKIIPVSGKCISYNNSEYEGNIFIIIEEGNIYVINKINLESYVNSVVSHEVFPNWSDESLQVAAITARTYAIHLRDKAIKNKKLFHIKNSIEHQRYNGKNLHKKIEDAVTKTKNQIIINKKDGAPILAMYHVCCGGVIPTHCAGFDFEKYPYLKRTKKCTGCQHYRRYSWQKFFAYNEIIKQLQDIVQKAIRKIKKIKKIVYAKSGTVRKIFMEVEIAGKKNRKKVIEIILNHKTIRKLFNIKLSLDSSFFKIKFDNNFNAEIIGKGHGHHIGLCQRGMQGYSEEGKSVDEIIAFYYPETSIITLQENILC